MANTVDLKAVISAQDNASGVLSGFADKTRNSFVSLGATVAKFGAAAVAGIGVAGVSAIKTAANMQMLRTSLDTLTGSADKGAKIFKELNQFASKTPFQTTDLAKATQTMLGFGISADKALENLKMLGDVSLGDANKLQGLTVAFSQISSTGRLMGQDLLQMINNGFNPLTIISQKTGKSMAELKDQMEKGAISADMVREAFKTATSEGGLFFEGMDRGARTFNGVMSTLQDNLLMAVRNIVGLSDTGDIIKGGLFDKVSQAAQNMVVWLNANKDAIVSVATAFLTDFMNAAQTAIGVIVNVIRWLNEHREVAKGLALFVGVTLTAAFAAWAVAVIAATWPILAIGAAITGIILEIKALISHWGEIKAFFNGIGDAVDRVASKLGALGGAFKTIANIGINNIPGVGLVKKILGFADGGNFSAGKPILVGERGPELIVPRNSGTVIPNNDMGGSSTINVNFLGNISMNSDADINEVGRKLAQQIKLVRQGAS